MCVCASPGGNYPLPYNSFLRTSAARMCKHIYTYSDTCTYKDMHAHTETHAEGQGNMYARNIA